MPYLRATRRVQPVRRNLTLLVSAIAFVVLGLGLSTAGRAQDAESVMPAVMVTGTKPLPGLGAPLNEIPAPVQSARAKDLERGHASDLGEFMRSNLGSVYVNDTQGNVWQPDVNYRGYTASPLLGTPQGLAVYLDGVRMNQPFGDVVSWDLIPRAAIDSVTLMPGSNPLFGLNALGGALAIQTKNGRTHPGASLQSTYGTHARRSVEIEHGGSDSNGLNWYITGNLFKDRGWRDDSPSDVRQLFGKLGWSDAYTDWSVSLAQADNALQGNGLQEQRLLEREWRSVYTKPDTTRNRSTLLNLTVFHEVDSSRTFSGNAYYRQIRTSTFNGDINEGALGQEVYQPNAKDRARHWQRPVTPDIRPAARQPATPRFRSGVALHKRCSRTSPQRSATA